MKWTIRTSRISHLLAVIAGVLIWQAVGKKSVKATQSPDNSSKRVVSRDPAEAEVRLQLGALQAENCRPLSSLDLPEEPLTKEPEVKKSQSQILLEMRSDDQADTAEELEAMLKRSEDFRKVKDLRAPLIDALTQGDQTHTAVAIFIEWYRRDPVVAMNELAARPSWSSDVLSEQAMVIHLSPEILLDQLDARNRSSDFRKAIIDSLAEHWVTADDLRGFSAAYDKLGGGKAEALMEAFLDERWVPREGAADLAYVSTGMSETCRKAFLTELLNQGSHDPSRDWTDGVAAGLIRQTLGEEQVAALRKEAAEQEGHGFSGGGCCGGFGEEGDATPDQARVAELMAEITPDHEKVTLREALDRMLHHDRDYLELFGTGKLSADQVFQEISAKIPGVQDHELGLRQELYQKLAIWNPRAAVDWASPYLSEKDLLSVTMESEGVDSEPRASRLLDLIENLPLKFEDERYVGYAPWYFYRSLRDWTKLDSEAANLALSRSQEARDIAEKIIKEPSTKGIGDLLPPLPDDELSY